MERSTVAVFMSLSGLRLEAVIVFRDPEKVRAHYDEKVREVFGSEKAYRAALSNGFPSHRFHVFEAVLE